MRSEGIRPPFFSIASEHVMLDLLDNFSWVTEQVVRQLVCQREPEVPIRKVTAGQNKRRMLAMYAQSISICTQRRQCHINGKVLFQQRRKVTERVTTQVEFTAR